MANPASLITKAPVTSLTTIESLTAFTLTFLIAHHVIGNVDIGTTTQTIAPFVSLALPALFGAAKWALVSPVAKVKAQLEDSGVISDADFGRVEAIIEAEFERHLAKATIEGRAELDEANDSVADQPRAGRLTRFTSDNDQSLLNLALMSPDSPMPRSMAAGADQHGQHEDGVARR